MKGTMNHAKTSFSTDLFTGAQMSVVQYLALLRYAISDWEKGSNTTKTSGQSWYQTNAQNYLEKPPWHEYVNCHGICVVVVMLLQKREPRRTMQNPNEAMQKSTTAIDRQSEPPQDMQAQTNHILKQTTAHNKQSSFHQRQAPFLAWFPGAMSRGSLNLWGPIITSTIP
jgi:hypothetical protein